MGILAATGPGWGGFSMNIILRRDSQAQLLRGASGLMLPRLGPMSKSMAGREAHDIS